MFSKSMMPSFGEVDAVEGELDIPVAGINKGDVELLCQKFVFLCKADGLCNQCIRRNPGTALHRWRCYQQDLLTVREQRIQKGFHPGGSFLCACALEQIVGA